METVKDWNTALLITGQGVEAEDIRKYTSQLREVDPSLLEANIAAAEVASRLPIARYMVDPADIFNNNAVLQMVVHTQNVTVGELARNKLATSEDVNLVVAGHSLGEAGAIHTAGVFLTTQASMEFVFERGSDMQREYAKYPRRLYMIDGISEGLVGKLPLELDVDLALINGPQLTLVAAEPGKLTEIEAEAKKLGARKVTDRGMLPFHTRWMLQAQLDLEKFARQKEYGNAAFPIVSNYDGNEPEVNGYDLIMKHIACITQPARWADVIATIKRPDMIYYALGPGGNIAGLNRVNGIPKEQTKGLFQLLAE